MYNHQGQITETTIANVGLRRRSSSSQESSTSDKFITPTSTSGLLNGLQRQSMLEKGEIVEGIITLQDLVS